ncbi:hypothetical protein SAMN05192544_104228 [Paraburkholderia hospita]|jgi:hypothetical protein|nr:hypothetical protein SAMN05192544_104228 [Paraburkholderia hospita]
MSQADNKAVLVPIPDLPTRTLSSIARVPSGICKAGFTESIAFVVAHRFRNAWDWNRLSEELVTTSP